MAKQKPAIRVDKKEHTDIYAEVANIANTTRSTLGLDAPDSDSVEITLLNCTAPIHKQRYRLQRALDRMKIGLRAIVEEGKLYLTA